MRETESENGRRSEEVREEDNSIITFHYTIESDSENAIEVGVITAVE